MYDLRKDSLSDLPEIEKERKVHRPLKKLQRRDESELDYFRYQVYHLHPCQPTFLGEKPNKKPSLWCCLFPFWVTETTASPYPSLIAHTKFTRDFISLKYNSRKSLVDSRDRKKKSVGFAAKAQVIPVESVKEMTFEEKADIWWQRSDYEVFQEETARVVADARPDEERRDWMQSSSNGVSLNVVQTLKTAIALSMCKRRIGNSTTCTEDHNDTCGTISHSRRGLECMVSIVEGRQRDIRVRRSIRVVIEEQLRQRILSEKYKLVTDGERIRMMYILNTAWARDLALAAGASDADALNQYFDDSRKSPVYFIHQINNKNFFGCDHRGSSFAPSPVYPSSTTHYSSGNPEGTNGSSSGVKYIEIPCLPERAMALTQLHSVYSVCGLET